MSMRGLAPLLPPQMGPHGDWCPCPCPAPCPVAGPGSDSYSNSYTNSYSNSNSPSSSPAGSVASYQMRPLPHHSRNKVQ